MLLARMNVLMLMQPYVGKYFSNTWVRKNLLQQGEEEIDEIDMEIMDEINNPQYAPPIDMMGGAAPGGPGGGGNGKAKTLHEEEGEYMNGHDPTENLSKLLNVQLTETLINALKSDEEQPS